MIPNRLPALDFGLGETADMLRDTVMSFAQEKIAPRADEPIWVGSVLALMGNHGAVRQFAHEQVLARQKDMQSFVATLSPGRAGISEAVVRPGS